MFLQDNRLDTLNNIKNIQKMQKNNDFIVRLYYNICILDQNDNYFNGE